MYIRRVDDMRREFIPRNDKVPLMVGDGFTLILDDHLYVLSQGGVETPLFTSIKPKVASENRKLDSAADPWAFVSPDDEERPTTIKKRPISDYSKHSSDLAQAAKKQKVEEYAQPLRSSCAVPVHLSPTIDLDSLMEEGIEETLEDQERKKKQQQEDEDLQMAIELSKEEQQQQELKLAATAAEERLASKSSYAGPSYTPRQLPDSLLRSQHNVVIGGPNAAASLKSHSSLSYTSPPTTVTATVTTVTAQIEMEPNSMNDMFDLYSDSSLALHSKTSSSANIKGTRGGAGGSKPAGQRPRHGLTPKPSSVPASTSATPEWSQSKPKFDPPPLWASKAMTTGSASARIASTSATNRLMSPGLPAVRSSREVAEEQKAKQSQQTGQQQSRLHISGLKTITSSSSSRTPASPGENLLNNAEKKIGIANEKDSKAMEVNDSQEDEDELHDIDRSGEFGAGISDEESTNILGDLSPTKSKGGSRRPGRRR